MKLLLVTLALLFALASGSMGATAESSGFSVASDGSWACSLPTTDGKEYRVTVSGTYYFGWYEGRLADAAYYSNAASFAVPNPFPSTGGFQLGYDGNPTVGMPYSPSHSYTFTLRGTGSAFCFWINDSHYQDNVESLEVRIAEVDSFLPPVCPPVDHEVCVTVRHLADSLGIQPPEAMEG